MTQKPTYKCEHCGKSFLLDKTTLSCSNCFACADCEEYVCPYCGGLHSVKLPRRKRIPQ